MFTVKDAKYTTWTPPKELLAEMKEAGSTRYLYEKKTGYTFTIKADFSKTPESGTLVKFANLLRRYINAHNEVCVLDFLPNHEKGAPGTVREVNGPALVDEIRQSMNGIVARQIKSAIYELHVVNDTLDIKPIMSGDIVLKGTTGAASEKKSSVGTTGDRHDNFSPDVQIGQLYPNAELHIDMIYMRPGRGFSKQLVKFVDGELIKPYDRTFFMHSGLTMFKPAPVADPMVNFPAEVRLEIPPQPYMDPIGDIVLPVANKLAADLRELIEHAALISDTYNSTYFSSTLDKNELTCTLRGYDEAIGTTLASFALAEVPNLQHASSHRVHPTKKEVILRLVAPDPIKLLQTTLAAVLAQTNHFIENI